MAEIHIERLSLDVPGLSAQRGERLARRIADGLAAAALGRGGAGAIPGLSISLRGAPGESDEALAGRIVAEIIQQFNQIA